MEQEYQQLSEVYIGAFQCSIDYYIMAKFEINRSKIKRYLYYHIIIAFLITVFIVILIVNIEGSYEFFWTLLIFAFCWQFFLFVLPLILMYLNYRDYNKGMILIIKKNTFKLERKGKKIEFSAEDIDRVLIFKSFNNYHNRKVRVALESNYYFSRIFLKNEKEVIITHLLCERIEKFLPKEKVTIEPVFYQYVKQSDNYWEYK